MNATTHRQSKNPEVTKIVDQNLIKTAPGCRKQERKVGLLTHKSVENAGIELSLKAQSRMEWCQQLLWFWPEFGCIEQVEFGLVLH